MCFEEDQESVFLVFELCFKTLQQIHDFQKKSRRLKLIGLVEADSYWIKPEQRVMNLSGKDAQQSLDY